MSYTDSLSGLLTRQYLTSFIQSEMKKNSSEKLCGIMLDIDKFKLINDTYGHLVGDDAISCTEGFSMMQSRQKPSHSAWGEMSL